MQITGTRPAFGSQVPEWLGHGFPSKEEWNKVQKWIKDKGLNRYGDAATQRYPGGSPTWRTQESLYQYITRRHPAKPWA